MHKEEIACLTKVHVLDSFRTKATALKVGATSALLTVATAVPAFASDSSGAIAIDFDVAEMFKFANIIISSLMPVVYIKQRILL